METIDRIMLSKDDNVVMVCKYINGWAILEEREFSINNDHHSFSEHCSEITDINEVYVYLESVSSLVDVYPQEHIYNDTKH